MSVSTTEVGSHAVRDLLKAYDLHHSGTETSSSQQQAVTEPTEANSQQDNPHWWPTNRRRMPAYRKPRTDHRFADRPAGRDNAEGVLVTVMFLGVFMNSAFSKIWHKTGGRLNNEIFHYEIGGDR